MSEPEQADTQSKMYGEMLLSFFAKTMTSAMLQISETSYCQKNCHGFNFPVYFSVYAIAVNVWRPLGAWKKRPR